MMPESAEPETYIPRARSDGEITRTVLWCSVLTALFTAVSVIAVLYFSGLLSAAGAVNFRGDGHAIASVQKLQQVWDYLSTDFYEPVDGDRMIEYAAAGMAASLGDAYTMYYTKAEMKAFSERSAGIYYGIGVYVAPGDNGRLRVTGVFDGSPAEEAGVLVDDEIMSVDGVDVSEIADSDKVVALIKGEAGASVLIGFYRPSEGRVVELSVERREIKTDNIFSRLIYTDAGMPVGYIQIVMFDGSASEYFNRHLDTLLKSDIAALVIDLRDNAGGDFNETVKIADRLIGEGVIVYTEDRAGHREYRNSDADALNLPIRVLINAGSASASEILAGAIKDSGAGRLVGTVTFGKGLVQNVIELKDGAGLKYTRSRYFTPSGVCIQGTGIEPDIRIEPQPAPLGSENPAEVYPDSGNMAAGSPGSGYLIPESDIQLAAALADIEKAIDKEIFE